MSGALEAAASKLGEARLMHRYLAVISTCVLTLLLVFCGTGRAWGQECPASNPDGPSTPSQARTLQGLLVFHNGIRQWFELKLDAAQCGESSIQIIRLDENAEPLDGFRGCQIRSRGSIDLSPTGYYSLNLFQNVDTIEAVGSCVKKPPLPEYSGLTPDKRVRAYRVDMHVSYGSEDRPVIFHVTSAGRELRPWQAYASYMLTGGFVLYGQCGDGFVVDRVFGTPQAKPEHFLEPRMSGDMAAFDPERAAQSGKTDLHLGYTCSRGEPEQ